MIIAIVPAPGHEALVAEGPMGERPALLRGVIDGGWYPPGQLNEHRIPDGRRALVLHAPGDPKLGMLRAMGAAPGWVCSDAQVHCFRSFDGPCRAKSRHATGSSEWPLPGSTPDVLGEPNIIGTFDHPAARAFALAHLLVQRGIAAEVTVLQADKAKE